MNLLENVKICIHNLDHHFVALQLPHITELMVPVMISIIYGCC
jgi:hypothetical protein